MWLWDNPDWFSNIETLLVVYRETFLQSFACNEKENGHHIMEQKYLKIADPWQRDRNLTLFVLFGQIYILCSRLAICFN